MNPFFQYYRSLFSTNSKWFKGAFIWFLLSAAVGVVVFFIFPGLLQAIVSGFSDRFGAAPALDYRLALQIFEQNVLASVIALFGGIILGLGSILVIGVNGFILGFVITSVFALPGGVGRSLAVVLGGLVPHGIFEIPAFLISSALGLRLGIEWMLDSAQGQRLGIIKKNLKQGFLYLPSIALILLVAAFIEVYVSGWIVDKF